MREPDASALRIARLSSTPIVLVDVGASGGVKAPWHEISKHCSVIGFEPDRRAPNPSASGLVLDVGLWREKATLPFHLTRKQECSSIYPPNTPLLQAFANPGRFDIVRTASIELDRLDDVLARNNVAVVDFVKLDTQGAELACLEGAQRTLDAGVIGVEVEVEFAELYREQPLFSDVDAFLRSRGFQIFDLRPVFWKREKGRALGGPKGQLVSGDALYLRPASDLAAAAARRGESGSRDYLLRAVTIAALYGYLDFALEITHAGAEQLGAKTVADVEDALRWTPSRWANLRGRTRLSKLLRRLSDIAAPHHMPAGGFSHTRLVGNRQREES